MDQSVRPPHIQQVIITNQSANARVRRTMRVGEGVAAANEYLVVWRLQSVRHVAPGQVLAVCKMSGSLIVVNRVHGECPPESCPRTRRSREYQTGSRASVTWQVNHPPSQQQNVCVRGRRSGVVIGCRCHPPPTPKCVALAQVAFSRTATCPVFVSRFARLNAV